MKPIRRSLAIITIVMILCSFSVDRQHNMPRLGDTFTALNVAGSLCSDSTDGALIWDFSDFNSISKPYKIRIDSFADRPGQWVAVIKGCRHYFRLSGDTIFDMGYEQPGRRFTFTEGQIPFFTFSSAVSNSDSTAYKAICLVDEDVKELIDGTWAAAPQMTGLLITPDGDSIADATKIQVSMAYTIKMLPRLAADSTYNTAQSSQIQSISYWYANGYRYPVMIEKRVCNNANPGKSSFTYIPIDVQECLDDKLNEIIRNILAEKFNRQKNESESPSPAKPYTCTIDDNEQVIRLDFNDSYVGNMEFVIADIGGIVYKSGRKTIPNALESIIEIPFADLPFRSYYVVYIALERESFSETFSK